MNYPANVRVLRVPCSGRVNPQYILAAFNKGVDGVLVCGCHPGDCHYATGNYFAKRRLMAFKRLMEYTGLEPERFQVRWISGSEAGKFRDTVISVCEQVKALGPYNANGTNPPVILREVAESTRVLAGATKGDTTVAPEGGAL
jgi:coenzyme F420-reducing hydrogenase delta subunit